jgi:hypothetical protein
MVGYPTVEIPLTLVLIKLQVAFSMPREELEALTDNLAIAPSAQEAVVAWCPGDLRGEYRGPS